MLKTVLQVISWLAAIATVIPAIVYFYKADPSVPEHLANLKTAMLIATIVWFVTTPLWMGRAAKPEPTPMESTGAAS